MLHALWLPEITIRQGQVKSALFKGVNGLAGYAHLGGELGLGPFAFRA